MSGDQPAVAAFESEAQASEQSAFVARSIPDPQLSVGIQDYPVTRRTAFSPTEDEFTMYTIGIMREQVRWSKREAEAQRRLRLGAREPRECDNRQSSRAHIRR